MSGSDSKRDAETAFVKRLQVRDETAFNELMELYQGRVFALVYRMLGRRSDAEEVTQDAFVAVFRNIDRFRGDSKLSTWLFRIAVNQAKNHIKKHSRRPSAGSTDLETMAEHTSLEGGEGVSVGSVARPDEMLQGRQLEVIVKEAMLQLEPDFREVVVLRDVEDLTYEEIAEITDLPRGTVKSRIHRGRAELRQRVERILGERLGSARAKKSKS